MSTYYPAIVAQMGTWKYYIVKMNMQQIANGVQFARDIHQDDHTLGDAVQRTINESRVKKEILHFLAYRDDRFFSSLVVASLGGNPTFYPITVDKEDPKYLMLEGDDMEESFGVLRLNKDRKLYALDGQHRLMAISQLLNPPKNKDGNVAKDFPEIIPPGFENEEVSVLMIVRKDNDETFLKEYRRLFSSLNRYAKPTDKDTNIIMDEDDAFAILTRRMITEYNFFQWVGRETESERILTKGKNLKSSQPYFTCLQSLYAMNRTLLSAAWRMAKAHRWGTLDPDSGGANRAEFERVRPSEEYLESLYTELVSYWDAILEAVPDLKKSPSKMRLHPGLPGSEDNDTMDHLLFWPIGQELFARLVRQLIDRSLPQDEDGGGLLSHPPLPPKDELVDLIKPLGRVSWDLTEAPWRFFLLTFHPDAKNEWKMRSEDRKDAVVLSELILKLMTGMLDLIDDEITSVKIDWQTRLTPAQTEADQNEMWEQILEHRRQITSVD